jgi:excisionase family DNA binding protein
MNANERDDEALRPEWLRYEEAQRLCGLGRTKLWQIGSSGEVRIARVGRAVRFNRRSLLEYMDRQAE